MQFRQKIGYMALGGLLVSNCRTEGMHVEPPNEQGEHLPAIAHHELVEQSRTPDQHPASVYLARLASGSRRTMKQALDTIAGIITGEQLDAQTLPWSQLHYQHTGAVRAELAERYAPARASKMLAALRGVRFGSESGGGAGCGADRGVVCWGPTAR